MCKFRGNVLCKLSKSEILRLYSIVRVAMKTTKTSNFTCQSKSFISVLYFSLAKFQLVSCNLFLAMIWQMTYTHKLPKVCSTTLIGLKHDIWQRSLVYFGYKLKFSCMRVINIFNPRGWEMHVMADIECVTIVVPAYQK